MSFVHSFLFHALPENIALFYFLMSLLRIRDYTPWLLFKLALIQSLLITVIRALPELVFGIHSLIAIISFSVILFLHFARPKLECIMAVLKAFVLLSCVEGIIFLLLTYKAGTQNIPDFVFQHSVLRYMVVLPQAIMIFSAGFLLQKYLYRSEKTNIPLQDNTNV